MGATYYVVTPDLTKDGAWVPLAGPSFAVRDVSDAADRVLKILRPPHISHSWEQAEIVTKSALPKYGLTERKVRRALIDLENHTANEEKPIDLLRAVTALAAQRQSLLYATSIYERRDIEQKMRDDSLAIKVGDLVIEWMTAVIRLKSGRDLMQCIGRLIEIQTEANPYASRYYIRLIDGSVQCWSNCALQVIPEG